ncbi:hypothetical protein ACFYXS_15055 [Streptomyces sp. NPDC002574]|uniref:hypothetical protein n=1 Tax=Streptomyces sp. NPDC002574 TaxID=3364652 RepID=UPI0036ACDD70
MSGSRAARKLAVAVSLLPLLAACGTEVASPSAGGGKDRADSPGQLDAPADASADLKKQYLVENAIAACMKSQGFTYTPVAPEDLAASWATDGADYELTEKHRQKYGFGFYAKVVYADDPQVPGSEAAEKNSTDTVHSDYRDTLTPEQRTAYDKALGGPPDPKTGEKDWSGCQGSAEKQVYGSTTPQQRGDETAAQYQANAQALNGDPKLIALAQSYASCLRKDGIPVTTTRPTEIGEMVKLQANSSVPPSVMGAVNSDGSPMEPMSKSEALPLLTKEIDLAMQDLECGKEFRAAYFPKFLKAPAPSGGGAG